MTADLRAAARVQTAFLPPPEPHLPGSRIAWHFSPCDELAGDTLNVQPFGTGGVALCVADVCGHGVASALLSVVLTRLLSHLPETLDPTADSESLASRPGAVARHLNDWFLRDAAEPEYFTLLYGIRDPESGTFRYVSAGHPGPILVPTEGPLRVLPSHAPAVGLFRDAEFVPETVRVRPGDRLYLYTDGVTETLNGTEEPFGRERLVAAVAETRGNPLNESVQQLAGTVAGWRGNARQEDDLTILAVELE
jgi:sigma-B regulation protein RsbU (phosphoserine phosphatase)